jgi:hypothetical protein
VLEPKNPEPDGFRKKKERLGEAQPLKKTRVEKSDAGTQGT